MIVFIVIFLFPVGFASSLVCSWLGGNLLNELAHILRIDLLFVMDVLTLVVGSTTSM